MRLKQFIAFKSHPQMDPGNTWCACNNSSLWKTILLQKIRYSSGISEIRCAPGTIYIVFENDPQMDSRNKRCAWNNSCMENNSHRSSSGQICGVPGTIHCLWKRSSSENTWCAWNNSSLTHWKATHKWKYVERAWNNSSRWKAILK